MLHFNSPTMLVNKMVVHQTVTKNNRATEINEKAILELHGRPIRIMRHYRSCILQT